MSNLLEMKNMTKKYGPFFANKDISFSLKKEKFMRSSGKMEPEKRL